MKRYEHELMLTSCAQVVNSPANKKALGEKSSVRIVPNGVALEQFAFEDAPGSEYDIVLSGNMGHFPHADAARIFATEIFPAIRARFRKARFLVVGANPPSDLRRLTRIEGVQVTGAVPDIRPYIRAATVAVAPSFCGNGLQLKILEAMAIGTPVVATTKAVGDAPLIHGSHLLIADTPDAFAGHVVNLLSDRELAMELRRSARTKVEETFTWERSANKMSQIYEEALR
jgi:glycosyltransferase involved in cell wall biosynthesis